MATHQKLPGTTDSVSIFGLAGAGLVGAALTYAFFGSMWDGGGLIGNDVYMYYLPQKAVYSESLKDGAIPLWNNRVGFGYPIVAESQTGSFYPFHLVLYRLLNVNTAYNANQLLHYVLAFVFQWMFARRMGIGWLAAGMAALIYVYGWFPPRICLEWAIIGGTWLPAALLSTETWLMTGRTRFLCLTAVVLTLQILAGHFHLAFITQLTVAVYVPARLWLCREGAATRFIEQPARPLAMFLAAFVLAFGMSAVQLLPTLHLLPHSQRVSIEQRIELGGINHPRFGSIPLWYYGQIAAPWEYYPIGVDAEGNPIDPDTRLKQHVAPPFPSTNRVESHLYFGLVTLVLLVYGTVRRSFFADRRLTFWLWVGLAALVYTSGYLVVITQHLPGFGFFIGPARYGIVTTLAVSLLAASACERMVEGFFRRFGSRLRFSHESRRRNARLILVGIPFGMLAVDFWLVNEEVSPARFLQPPPIESLKSSSIRRAVRQYSQPTRMLARTPNVLTLAGTAQVPTYLGYGPAAYFDADLDLPRPVPYDASPTPGQMAWLERAGVTHIISFEALDDSLPLKLRYAGGDEFLEVVWGLRPPLLLYELTNTRGRTAWLEPEPNATARITQYEMHQVTVDAYSENGGTVVLTDLAFPGWHVTVDGGKADPILVDGQFRGVAVASGLHTIRWTYEAPLLRLGGIISLGSIGFLLAMTWLWSSARGGLRDGKSSRQRS